MAQMEMFPAVANSPATELTAAITDVQTTITLLDASKLPDAPNIATIGVDETAETVRYEGKNGNDLTGVTRGFSGTVAKAWATGVGVARYFTAYDADALRGNVAEHGAQLAYLAERKNVQEFGVIPDGRDCTAAMQAIADGGGYWYMPNGVYTFSRRVNFTNFIDILGDRPNAFSGSFTGTVLSFNIPDSDLTAVNFNENGSCSILKNVMLYNASGNKTVDGLSSLTSGQYFRRFTFDEVYVSGFKYGFYLPTCYLGRLVKCYSQYNSTGFHFQGFSTSLVVEGCYALDNDEINYFINNLTYSNFTACASDGSKFGYWLKANRGVNFDACGAENIGVCVMYIDNDNKNIVVNALTAYGTSTIANPTTNLGSMIHVAGINVTEIVINGVYELTKNNIGTRPFSINIGSTIRSTLNNHTVEGQVAVGHCCLHNGRYMNNAVPTTGYHEAGEMVWNSNSSGDIVGWHCYLTGTPGTYLTVRNYNPGSSISGTPPYVGKVAIVAGVAYMATGTASNADWKQISN